MAIDPAARSVAVLGPQGASSDLTYDRLIIATGARPVLPDIPGINLPGVCPLHTMGDALAVNDLLERASSSCSAVIVGAGYIGLEMAEALVGRGIDVTVLSRSGRLFPTVDTEFGTAIKNELARHGVHVVRSGNLEEITAAGDGRRLVAHSSEAEGVTADLILVAVGVQPDSRLAASAGVTLGTNGAINVDRAMRTSVPEILAAGDCAETWHRLLQRNLYLPLGTTSHKQGRVAGETAVGRAGRFEGCVGTQVVKLFDLVVARTGLLDCEAREAGFAPTTVETEAWDHKAYYPDASKLRLRVTGDRATGRLLGAQILGTWGKAEVSKRIDVFATALFHEMRVDAMSDLDLSYAPPFSSPWEPVQMASQAWSARL
jgi:NADPH-dependent 2,4-dienoyl-CoA reductase/sulfur reductase-like enzyme